MTWINEYSSGFGCDWIYKTQDSRFRGSDGIMNHISSQRHPCEGRDQVSLIFLVPRPSSLVPDLNVLKHV